MSRCGDDEFYDDRAPPPPSARPRKLYRSRGTCPSCGVASGEVHLETCEREERFIG